MYLFLPGNLVRMNIYNLYIITDSQVFQTATVLPVKNDSDVMFCLQIIRDLESIDHLCINPIRRIG